jgi:hypothetical protein
VPDLRLSVSVQHVVPVARLPASRAYIGQGKILADLPIGRGSDGAVFNPTTMEAFSSQGDGTLTVVKENSPTSFVVEQTLKTPVHAKTLTLDPTTGKIFLITAEFGEMTPGAAGQRYGRSDGPLHILDYHGR